MKRCVPILIVLLLCGCGANRIHHAVAAGDAARVQSLVQSGADIETTVPNRPPFFRYVYMTPLQVAAERGDEAMIRLLLGLGAKVDGRLRWRKETPLHYAAAGGHLAAVRALLAAGADSEVGDEKGKTPGDLALANGFRNVYAVLAPRTPAAEPPAAPRPEAPALPAENPRYRTPERSADLAVVVGIEKYSDLPEALYAENDAAAMREHFEALGVPVRNIAFLSGPKAGRASMEKYLEDWLPRLVKPSSRVYFYFSGHGSPDPKTGEPYLVPWDGDANFLARTAYPVKRLYDKLASLGAAETVVMLDACFSGGGGRSVLPKGARPLVAKTEAVAPSGTVAALTAAAGDEITSGLDAARHGAFTYYLLKGLNGAAANGSGKITLRSLHEYLKPRVQDEARRLNRDQTPQLSAGEPLAQAPLR